MTTLTAGTLKISADNNLGAAPGSVTATQLTLNGGTLNTTASFTLSTNRGITLTANSGIEVNSSTKLIYNGVITGGYGLTINSVNQSGTAAFIGSNNYSGGTTLSSGSLGVYHNSALGSGVLTLADNTNLILGRAVSAISNNISLSGNAIIDFDLDLEYLVVAGGGGGGSRHGGGGGAGGVLTGTTSIDAANVSITVGAGGNGMTTGASTVGGD
jgi:hypothetical protein